MWQYVSFPQGKPSFFCFCLKCENFLHGIVFKYHFTLTFVSVLVGFCFNSPNTPLLLSLSLPMILLVHHRILQPQAIPCLPVCCAILLTACHFLFQLKRQKRCLVTSVSSLRQILRSFWDFAGKDQHSPDKLHPSCVWWALLSSWMGRVRGGCGAVIYKDHEPESTSNNSCI